MPIETFGPDGASLHEVRGADSPLLDVACNLFAEIFPEDIRYLPYVRACAQGQHPSHPKTYDHVWLVQQNGVWTGVRIFSYITTRDFGHGAYIGFLPNHRGRGVGRWLVQQTLAQLDEDAQRFGRAGALGYLVEVERPIDADNETERRVREKRLRFHRQCGGIILPVPYIEPVMIEGVDYIMPEEMQGEEPRPMHLTLVPTERGAGAPSFNLVDLVYGIYYDVYRLPRGHEFVANSLSFLFDGVLP